MSLKTLAFRAARLLRGKRPPGYIDHFDVHRIAGWAFNPLDRGTPALLSLYIDGRPEMNIVADIPREDVQSAGLGPLRCGFEASLPKRLRDGHPHTVELRLGNDGAILPGGQLSVPGQPGALLENHDASDLAVQPVASEGIAFVDTTAGLLTGWAIGCNTVTVRFDDGDARFVPLDREVSGFGSGLRAGFKLPIPAALQDNLPHHAHVFFGNSTDALDGTPLQFTLTQRRYQVLLDHCDGQSISFHIQHPDQNEDIADGIRLYADGTQIDSTFSGSKVTAKLPPQINTLLVSDEDDMPLARFEIVGQTAISARINDLPKGALSAASCSKAQSEFEAFCEAPDDQFDPLWYRWSQPDTYHLDDPKALIEHYKDIGARRGDSPGPWFDEMQTRHENPALAQAISESKVPCAFALKLVLDESMPSSLKVDSQEKAWAHVEKARAESKTRLPHADASPIVARLPLSTPAQHPAQDIYAAWMARLDIDDKMRHEIELDEFSMRRDIASVALTRQPLVTIIMPSWNRAFTIGEAIQSVLAQSYSNWELIICDDASEDRTADVVRGFDDPRIRYMKFLKSNGAGARNKGLHHARGEYISYLDSDNIWHPLFLDLMLRKLMASPANAIAYSAYLDTEIKGAQVVVQNIARPNFRPIPLSSKNFMDLNTIVHHRRIFDWMGGFDAALPRLQDWDLVLRYTSIFRPIYVNRIGVFYRRNVAWGQVTHLFMGSDAQNTVNEKTQRRLAGNHERLQINAHQNTRLTILCGGPEGHQPGLRESATAKALATMASEICDVDLVELGVENDHVPQDMDLPSNLRHHHIPMSLQRDPYRLSNALGGIIRGQPVVSIGCRGTYLRAIEGTDPRLIWRLRRSGNGIVLQGLDTPKVQFDLGALHLELPKSQTTKKGLLLAFLPPKTPPEAFCAEAHKRGLSVLLPPGQSRGWVVSSKSGSQDAVIDPISQLPEVLAQVSITATLVPVSSLDPFSLALLNTLQGNGVPAAVLPDEGRARATGFARQWLDARAAYEIKVNTPKWICDKLRKLLDDTSGMDRLSERSRIVHSIAWHPQLAQQKLVYALHEIQHGAPDCEVLHAN